MLILTDDNDQIQNQTSHPRQPKFGVQAYFNQIGRKIG